MKDSYSFDIDDEGLVASYEQHRNAYISLFDRLGLKYNIVSAVSGAMGGSRSEEFLAPCDTGEDTYVLCPQCGYAANVEAMVTKIDPYEGDTPPAMQVFDSPNTPTIDSLVQLLNERHGGGFKASDTLKNVLLMADGKAISILVPGDREVDLKRVEANLPGVEELRLFEEADFAKFPGLVKGYVGPQVAKAQGITVYADPRIVKGSHWITGANVREKHVMYVTHGRDFEVDGFIEAAQVLAGDKCPQCATPVVIDRAIEIGHIFQLGRKYAEALDLTVLDKDGKARVVTMGSYGVGVSRAVAAIVEQSHDEIGIIWPREVAPADVHIVATGKDDLPFDTAETLALELEGQGLRVMLDDRRDASPGVKFKDAELIGNPYIVIVGKALADGKIELRNRRSGDKVEIPLADASNEIHKVVTSK
jgi:prolyl-tRNA synthetase